MGSIFVDISELVGWNGKLTGVPRVMNELSSRLMADDRKQFVYWNKRSKSLEIANYVPINPDPDSDGVPVQKTGISESVKRLIRKSSMASRMAEVTKAGVKAVRVGKINMVGSGERVMITKGDTILVLADWHGSDPNFIVYLENAKRAGVKIIQVSYDLLPIVTPQYSGHSTKTFTRYVNHIYPIADTIVTISEYTKNDIIKWLTSAGLQVPPIEVIRLGDDFRISQETKPCQRELASLVHGAEYVLCVGTIEARKNHLLLYYAYKFATRRGIYLPPVVIVGRLGWMAQDIYAIMSLDPEVKDKFVFMQSISDGELAWLYAHCIFTVYPSFYEGWGLPVAESIAYGVPCVASSTSSIPEIAGDLLTYFDPYSPEELLKCMTDMLDADIRASAHVLLKSYRHTSWNSCFDSVDGIINSING